jgi:hypothetical protein
MTDANMKASLYLKNTMKTNALTVTPSFYLSNGVRYTAPPVTLEPSGTAIIDVNQALAQQGIAPYASLYGYAEIEYQWPWAPVTASIRNVDALNSLIFVYPLQQPPQVVDAGNGSTNPPSNHVLEGLWWKHEKDVSGFLGLANVTGQAINATVRVTDTAEAQLAEYHVTISPHGTKMITLGELKSAASSTGGVYVSHDGDEHGLAISGGLRDQAVGYSARLPLLPSPQPGSNGAPQSPIQIDFVELGLMTGAADPMMNFPSGTVFTPYSMVRNISDKAATTTPTVWWMSGGAPQSVQLPPLKIAPHRTLNLNAPALIASAGLNNFNGTVNLVLDTEAEFGALVLASGSVDQTNTYVFEVAPRAVGEGGSQALCYWSTGNGDDTMVTLWNGADEEQDLVFTLFFSGGQYAYPLRLPPRATRTFNISEILNSSIPDNEGNIIPAGVFEGSAEIAGSQGEHQHILVSMDAGVYNVRKGTCIGVCVTCNGEIEAFIVVSPFSVAVGATQQETFYMQYNTGTQYSLNGHSSWSSSATNVATVSTGLVSGVSLGSPLISAEDLDFEPAYESCVSTSRACAQKIYEVKPAGSTPGNVGKITVHFANGAALTSGDNLSWSNVAQTCSNTLGLKDCSTKYPSAWVYNVEIEADVPDNAANYTVSQEATGLSKGNYKNQANNGALTSFSTPINSPPPQENPPSAALQQIAGQKVIFWLDAPGRGTIYTDPNTPANTGPIDSMTSVKNFTSSVCSKANPSNCYTVNWYLKLVVNSGGTLDTVNSTVNFGSLPLNF